MNEEQVILVDFNDLEIGAMDKLQAHKKGLLHRAFSIFIFNSKGELLLQKRNKNKYHSGGLWTNTCCSHPRPGEKVQNAAVRRLKEEMGMDTVLYPAFSFQYRAELDQSLIENELDHVFIGYSNELPILNSEEAEGFCYLSPEVLSLGIQNHPEDYTAWLKICFEEVMNNIYKTKYDEKVS